MHLNAHIDTGGAEFIGSHLTERLLADGNEVLCVDNFFTGPRRNIHHLLDRTGFELRGVRESLLAASPAERFDTCLTSTIGSARLLLVLRVFCRRGDQTGPAALLCRCNLNTPAVGLGFDIFNETYPAVRLPSALRYWAPFCLGMGDATPSAAVVASAQAQAVEKILYWHFESD